MIWPKPVIGMKLVPMVSEQNSCVWPMQNLLNFRNSPQKMKWFMVPFGEHCLVDSHTALIIAV